MIDQLEHFVRELQPLAPYTWLRLGGPAQYFAEPTSIAELAELISRANRAQVPVRVLGSGSNVLVPDEGVTGIVVHLSAPAFSQIVVEPTGTITAGGGAKLGHVISTAVREGWGGLEPLVGIPGTIGGALRGNASSQGTDIGQWTVAATVMSRTSDVVRHGRDALRFAYRQSSLDELVILEARFQLERAPTEELTRRMQKLWIIKRAADAPGGENCARMFIDPHGMQASELIEQVGLKGIRAGAAEISPHNANCVIARTGATSQDVRKIIDIVKARVFAQLSIELQTEIQIW